MMSGVKLLIIYVPNLAEYERSCVTLTIILPLPFVDSEIFVAKHKTSKTEFCINESTIGVLYLFIDSNIKIM